MGIPVEVGTYSTGKAGGQALLDTQLDSPDDINDDNEPWKCHIKGAQNCSKSCSATKQPILNSAICVQEHASSTIN